MRASTLIFLGAAWLLPACERKTTPVVDNTASGGAAPRALPPSAPSFAAPAPPPVPGADAEIRLSAPGQYAVSRRLFDDLTQACRLTLERGPTMKPFDQDGRTIGVQLTKLKPNGWLRQLGLREGDVLTDVNGKALSSSQRFLETYAEEWRQTSFRVGILRDGQRVEQSYTIGAR